MNKVDFDEDDWLKTTSAHMCINVFFFFFYSKLNANEDTKLQVT